VRRWLTATGVLGCVLILAGPTVAGATTSTAVADCSSHGRLTRTYSVAQLQTALGTMPADIQEYTNCYDVIKRALLDQASTTSKGGGGSDTKSSGSFLPTPVIVVLALVVLVGAVFGALAMRRRTGPSADGQ
jgi:hypothetical protein